MGCPSEAAIQELVERRGDPRRRRALELHLADCESCTAVVAAGLHGELAARTAERYLLLEVIGAGGMGEVYAAYDVKLDRKIALKLLHPAAPGTDERAARQRLAAEAQAMARLSHPNVVAIHDVGTLDDQVFIAMELVAGTTLRGWLEAAPRRWQDILARFRAAGAGLAAAHAAGLVHRDFKPDNVLVGRDGRVQVGDFGLARPLQGVHAAADRGGTPAYMAPEQLRDGTATEASDQFSFCVALLEALSGERPHAGATLDEVGAALERTAPRRRAPRHLRRIVERGLRVDPAARFPSMTALLAELGRDPARRRWIAAGAVAAVAGALAVIVQRQPARDPCGGAASTLAASWDPVRAARLDAQLAATGKPYATSTARSAVGLLDDYAARWTAASTDACRATRVHHDQPESVLSRQVACFEDRRRDLGALVDRMIADPVAALDVALFAIRQLPSPARCADPGALVLPVAVQHDIVAEARAAAISRALAEVRADNVVGRFDAAAVLGAEAAREAAALGAPALEADALLVLGAAQLSREQHALAEATLVRAAAAASAGHAYGTYVRALIVLIGVAFRQARYDTAEAWGTLARAAVDRLGDRWMELQLEITLGTADEERHEYARAATQLRHAQALIGELRASDPGGPPWDQMLEARNLTNLGIAVQHLGALDEARDALERALAIVIRVEGAGHPDVAVPLDNLADLYAEQADDARALATYQRAIAVVEATLGVDHLEYGAFLFGAAESLERLGRTDEAITAAGRALATLEHALAPTHPMLAYPLTTLGRALARRDPATALADLERALALREHSAVDPRALAHTAWSLAAALATRAPARAHTLAARAHELLAAAPATPSRDRELAEVDAWLAHAR